MPHTPIKDLVTETRAKAKECLDRGAKTGPYQETIITDQFAYDMAGWLANHADHVEALLNDYSEG